MQLGALYLPLVLLFVFLLLQIFGTTFPVCKVLSSFLVKSLQPVQFWPEQAYVLHFLHRSIFLLCTNILQYLTYGYIRIQQSFQFVQFTIFSTSCLAFFAPNTVFLSAVFLQGISGGNRRGGQHFYLPKYRTCHSTRIKSELQIHISVSLDLVFRF